MDNGHPEDMAYHGSESWFSSVSSRRIDTTDRHVKHSITGMFLTFIFLHMLHSRLSDRGNILTL